MRTRTKGIQVTDTGDRVIEKKYQRRRIFIRLGAVSQEEAERRLRQEENRIDAESGKSTRRYFCDAAEKYLKDCEKRKVRSIDDIAWHITLVLPFIGTKPLEAVHSDSLESFCDSRIDEDKVSPTTVNRTLEVVKTILIKSARVWRGEDGKAWLETAPPLIQMLATNPRQPYPITWDEQRKLFAELPSHIERMALFAVNTGMRDENICGLRWEWERKVPELGTSVFVIPAQEFKSNRKHVAILNDIAAKIIESCRGAHKEFVFTYRREVKDPKIEPPKPDRIETINNNGWQKARKRAGLAQVRVHDLRHTFGQRLRDAGVSNEDRAVLMGHATINMSDHYATPTIAKLIEMANLVSGTRDTPTLSRVING